jgi:uncharacterized protein
MQGDVFRVKLFFVSGEGCSEVNPVLHCGERERGHSRKGGGNSSPMNSPERSDRPERERSRAPARDFQVFVKPAGALCNLACRYCYYREKDDTVPGAHSFRMPEDILEATIVRHIEAADGPVVGFSWHGGEPTMLGVDYFRTIVSLQRKHLPPGRRAVNAIQTNGTLLDDRWCRFLRENGFVVGLSVDGPEEFHDRHRRTVAGEPTFRRTMRGYELLKRYGIPSDILCVVHADNVGYPLDIYGFFREIGARHVSFLPLVVRPEEGMKRGAGLTVPADAWGEFLCAVFDEWIQNDIGRIEVQIFEEAARTAFGREHSLCVFRPTCGDIPVIERNGDVYSCDHYVDPEHRLGNIRETALADLLESPAQRKFGQAKLDSLPRVCLSCEVRTMCNGGCPKDRSARSPDGVEGLNLLCAGYRRFFRHCMPFVAALAALGEREASPDGR